MAQVVEIYDTASQLHRYRVGEKDMRMLFNYNISADLWSMTVWLDQEFCPALSGRSVIPEVDLFLGYFNQFNVGEMWLVLAHDTMRTANWYDRLIKREGVLVLTTAAERAEIEQRLLDETKREYC